MFNLYRQSPALAEDALDAAADDEEDDPCVGKRCTANEHCCDGHVCVDTEDDAMDVCEYHVT